MSFEVIVGLVSLGISLFFTGVVGGFCFLLMDNRYENKEMTEKLDKQVGDFNDITKKASEANNSLGIMCSELQSQISVLDERISQISGTLPNMKGASTWSERKYPPPQGQ
jgi:hypothetical protein